MCLSPPQPHKGKGCSPKLTFVVQKVKGAGNIPHHHAGLQLVEVAPPMDVGQDGACSGRERSEGSGGSAPCHHPRAPRGAPNAVLTSSHFLKHQVKPLLLLKELDQLQDVPAGTAGSAHSANPQKIGVPPTATSPPTHCQHQSPGGATKDRRQQGIASQVIESKQPGTPQPHSGYLGLGGGGGFWAPRSALIARRPLPAARPSARVQPGPPLPWRNVFHRLEMLGARPKGGRREGGREGRPAEARGWPRSTCVPGTGRASPPPGRPCCGCGPGASR